MLIQLGAIIVGKSKLQAMFVREDLTEGVDFSVPFNPRADGYQGATGSSNGSCAAIGRYDWLDLAIGSDSQSIPMIDETISDSDCSKIADAGGRKPGQFNGCFAVRPTHGMIDKGGLVGYFP